MNYELNNYMGIRLNKVLTELNIGLQTAVDFLKKKSELGEIRDDATSNTKISDQQYGALVQEFSSDKAVKTQASTLFPKKNKEKKQELAKTKTEEKMAQRQQFTPLGKIDLDSIGKPKPATTVQKPVASEPQPAPKPAAESPAKIVEKPEVKPQPTPKPVEEKKTAKPQEPVAPVKEKQEEEVKPVHDEPVVEPQKVVVEEVKPVTPQPEKTVQAEQEPESEPEPASAGPEIYTLKSEAKLAPKVNVLGKIDLSTLNQSTRPKKKSKEEKRKQREEKAAQQRGGAQGAEKKKRERIHSGKEKVDIEESKIGRASCRERV